MTFHVYDIDWDTDGDEDVSLPSEVEVEADCVEDIADALSDEYGFCINGFNYEGV